MMVTLEFRGLVALVSDRSTMTGPAMVLFPNATEPDADWIPEILHFTQPHHPRLFLRRGRVAAGSALHTAAMGRCADTPAGPQVEVLQGADLTGKHVSILTNLGTYIADRSETGNPNSDGVSRSSLRYVADMEELARRADPVLGAVSQDLLQTNYAPGRAEAKRISARMEIGGGNLESLLWQYQGQYPRSSFLEKRLPTPGHFSSYEAYLAEALVLSGSTSQSSFKLGLRDLSGGNVKELALEPNEEEDEVHVLIENGDDDCDPDSQDFLGHYLLRDRWDLLVHDDQKSCAVRIPDTSAIIGGPSTNPQCSPTDHAWPPSR